MNIDLTGKRALVLGASGGLGGAIAQRARTGRGSRRRFEPFGREARRAVSGSRGLSQDRRRSHDARGRPRRRRTGPRGARRGRYPCEQLRRPPADDRARGHGRAMANAVRRHGDVARESHRVSSCPACASGDGDASSRWRRPASWHRSRTSRLSNALRSALLGWSKTLASEVAGDGVTVNMILPGRIATARVAALDKASVRADRQEHGRGRKGRSGHDPGRPLWRARRVRSRGRVPGEPASRLHYRDDTAGRWRRAEERLMPHLRHKQQPSSLAFIYARFVSLRDELPLPFHT